MKWFDRFIGAVLLAMVAAIVLPPLLPPLTLAFIVATTCYVVVQLTRYFTDRW
jgi:cytochrome c oxidase subunit IV